VLAPGAQTTATGYAATGDAATGDEATWALAMTVDPLPHVGVSEPLEGIATARVQGGRITSLLLVPDSASVQRRQAASTAALVATSTAAHVDVGGGGLLGHALAPRAVEDAPAGAWPLALGGLGAFAALIMGLRRRAPAGERRRVQRVADVRGAGWQASRRTGRHSRAPTATHGRADVDTPPS
jgi:hypothetical protein